MLEAQRLNPGETGGRVSELREDGQPLSAGEVLTRLEGDLTFRAWFLSQLRETPQKRIGWETPPVSSHTLEQPFRQAVVPRPSLSDTADPRPFQEYFTPQALVVDFPNLGGDAQLSVPTPRFEPFHAYAHLAAFLADAPLEQQHAVWKHAAKMTLAALSEDPLWLNTAGGGVDWLHIRLDSRPKYYRWGPFTAWQGRGR